MQPCDVPRIFDLSFAVITVTLSSINQYSAQLRYENRGQYDAVYKHSANYRLTCEKRKSKSREIHILQQDKGKRAMLDLIFWKSNEIIMHIQDDISTIGSRDAVTNVSLRDDRIANEIFAR